MAPFDPNGGYFGSNPFKSRFQRPTNFSGSGSYMPMPRGGLGGLGGPTTGGPLPPFHATDPLPPANGISGGGSVPLGGGYVGPGPDPMPPGMGFPPDEPPGNGSVGSSPPTGYANPPQFGGRIPPFDSLGGFMNGSRGQEGNPGGSAYPPNTFGSPAGAGGPNSIPGGGSLGGYNPPGMPQMGGSGPYQIGPAMGPPPGSQGQNIFGGGQFGNGKLPPGMNNYGPLPTGYGGHTSPGGPPVGWLGNKPPYRGY